MKTTTLNLLKPGAKIKCNNKNYNNHLYAIGIAPDRNIKLIKRKKDLYIAKVEKDNPFCFGDILAKAIKVNANDHDTYNSVLERNIKESFLAKILNFFLRLKK